MSGRQAGWGAYQLLLPSYLPAYLPTYLSNSPLCSYIHLCSRVVRASIQWPCLLACVVRASECYIYVRVTRADGGTA